MFSSSASQAPFSVAASSSVLAVERVDCVDSTNLRLLDAPFEERARPPRLLWAARQTAGRGRRGRSWLAEPGRSLCFSVAIEGPAQMIDPSLTLAIGVTLARALAPSTDALGLKWPNDLLRQGAKCGGILVEHRRGGPPDARIDRLVIGIGLNLLRPEDPMAHLTQRVEGLYDVLPDAPTTELLVRSLGEQLLVTGSRHRAEGFAPFMSDWNRFDHWLGRNIRITDGDRIVAEGPYRGVGHDGRLIVDTVGGERRIVAGDVSLRPT